MDDGAKLSKDDRPSSKKVTRRSSFINALFIGFLIGIVLWSVWKNTLGLVSLIPLYMIYRLVKGSNNMKA